MGSVRDLHTALFEIEQDPAYKAAKKDRERIAKIMSIQAITQATAAATATAQAAARTKTGSKSTSPLAPGHNPPGMGKKSLKKAKDAALAQVATGETDF